MMWARRIKRLHFVGIGGAGMSGIAEILHASQFAITGSDMSDSETIAHLRGIGISVHIGHDAKHVEGADVVVISSAVTAENPEVIAAHEAGIPVIRRAEMLGELMRLKSSIGIAGTHGKTTTTSMIGHIIMEAGLDPTVIVGGRLISHDANAQFGQSEYLVAEADEYDHSFLCLHPTVAVATNLEEDHLDCYRDLADLQDNFVEFFARVPFYGAVLTNADSPALSAIVDRIRRRHRTFGFSEEADTRADALELMPRRSSFDLWHDGKKLGRIEVNLPGRHNAENALAAAAVALEIDIPFEAIRDGLKSFKGVGRRFEVIGQERGITVVDDYAHHPTEVDAVLRAARTWLDRKGRLIVAFQPHLYSRTRDFYKAFADALSEADGLILAPIYPAREAPLPGVTSAMIKSAVSERVCPIGCHLAEDLDDVVERATAWAQPGDLVMTVGAGTIYRCAPAIVKRLSEVEVGS
ncbi:MAG: UDP-N-acetylmuramate--L-alanine ligase [Candidatus Zixiibacteriota bacterium]